MSPTETYFRFSICNRKSFRMHTFFFFPSFLVILGSLTYPTQNFSFFLFFFALHFSLLLGLHWCKSPDSSTGAELHPADTNDPGDGLKHWKTQPGSPCLFNKSQIWAQGSFQVPTSHYSECFLASTTDYS